MEIGVIGVGNITLNLVQRAAQSGFTILLNSPLGNCPLKEIVASEKNIKLANLNEVASADIILLFLCYENLEKVLGSLPDMKGKIILHTNNPIFNPLSVAAEISAGSAAAKTATLLPGADIVKLYNVLQPDPEKTKKEDNAKSEIFFSGENKKAKNKIKSFLNKLNFCGVDLAEHRILNYI